MLLLSGLQCKHRTLPVHAGSSDTGSFLRKHIQVIHQLFLHHSLAHSLYVFMQSLYSKHCFMHLMCMVFMAPIERRQCHRTSDDTAPPATTACTRVV